MAFAFFRRRQKLVVILMVILMVSFLVTLQGLQMLTETDEAAVPLGTTREGEVLTGEVWSAGTDLAILQTVGQAGLPPELSFIRRTRDPELIFALLLKEARAAGVTASEQDVTLFLEGLGYTGASYDAMVRQLRQARRGMTEDRIRQAMANALIVYRNAVSRLFTPPPAEPEVQRSAQMQMEQVDARVLKIPADRFIEKVREPNEVEIREQFQALKDRLPGRVPTGDGFLFGYRQPDRVRLSWLLIRQDVIGRVLGPAPKEVKAYYESPEHAQEFLRGDGSRVPFSEAGPQIANALRARALSARINVLVETIGDYQGLYDQAPSDQPHDSSFHYAVARMTRDGNEVAELLNTRSSIYIEDATVPEALESLAQQTSLEGVYFPYRLDPNRTLDPNVRIKLSGTMTIGKALDEISRQAKWETFRWARCEGLGQTLFPVGHDSFPLQAGVTEMLSRREMIEDQTLGAAMILRDQRLIPLTPVAFAVPGLVDPNQASQALGQNGRTMTVLGGPGEVALLQQFLTSRQIPPQQRQMMVNMLLGQARGQLMWRTTAAQPSAVPESLTPAIEAQVRRDWKLRQGFELAHEAAKRIDSIPKFAKALGEYESVDTGLVSREAVANGRAGLDFLEVIGNPGLSARLRDEFIKVLFSPSLIPENPDGPFPAKSDLVVVKRVPSALLVTLVRRIGYEPMMRQDYLDRRQQMYRQMWQNLRMQEIAAWIQGTAQRMNYSQRQS